MDDWTRLERFLRLGTEAGVYRVPAPELTRDGAGAVLRCLTADGARTVGRIATVAGSGRAPRAEPAVFALALAAAEGDDETRRLALAALPEVCRSGELLLRFAGYVGGMRGWGRGLREAVGRWYAAMPEDELARQMVRHPAAGGWSHRDLLRLSHPKPDTDARRVLYHWATHGWPGVGREPHDMVQLRPIWAFEKVRYAHHAAEVAALVREYGLPREAVPAHWLKERTVWEALLSQMSLPELLESLPALSRVGLLADPEIVYAVAQTVTDRRRLGAARLHPAAILAAREAYARGHDGDTAKGRQPAPSSWEPSPRVLTVLDAAFDVALSLLPPTGRRFLIALDVSGSMDTSPVTGMPGPTARTLAAALTLARVSTEGTDCRVLAFTAPDGGAGHGGRYGGGRSRLAPVELPSSGAVRLSDVLAASARVPFGGVDCALPMEWALERGAAVDAFLILTDAETWYGARTPADALRAYRARTGLGDARLIVAGLSSPGFSVADPDDAGMLDLIGFDPAAPWLLADFAANGFST
jgi:60 kDa SS-A/Ro ribonucleoprotein